MAHLVTSVCYRQRRMLDDAVAAQRLATELSGGSAAMLGWLGLILAIGGQIDEARTGGACIGSAQGSDALPARVFG